MRQKARHTGGLFYWPDLPISLLWMMWPGSISLPMISMA
jgi:hypothetical protein